MTGSLSLSHIHKKMTDIFSKTNTPNTRITIVSTHSYHKKTNEILEKKKPMLENIHSNITGISTLKQPHHTLK